jgi:magnesium transporter
MNNTTTHEIINSVDIDFTPFFEALIESEYHSPDIAKKMGLSDWSLLLESLTNEQRNVIWLTIPRKKRGNILARMRPDSREQFLKHLSLSKITQIIETASNNDLTTIIGALPQARISRIINKLSPEQQQTVHVSQQYKDDEIGHFSNPDVITININEKLSTILDEITELGLPEYTDSLVVVDNEYHYLGLINLDQLLTGNENQSITELMYVEPSIVATSKLLDASNFIKNSKRSMLPVIDEAGKLIGRLSIVDALTIFQEYYETQISHLGQVSDEDLFAPVFNSARRRAVWLGINLLTAIMASIVIGVFDKVIAEVVALAILMPIVASMGGITGSQTLTLTIRGLATGQLGLHNINVLRNKELKVAFLNGMLWALTVALLTGYWFESSSLSLVIGIALIVNMIVAALAGILVPVTLVKMKVDPALAGSVVLTTVTDVVGFFVFLGSASLLFL